MNFLDPHQQEQAVIAMGMARYYVQLAKARTNPNDFVEFLMRDEAGQVIVLAPLHKIWTAHIDYCWEHGLYAAILGPMGHGKTAAIVIGRTLYEIGRNRNIRAKIICGTDKDAGDRVATIKNIIEYSPQWKILHPTIIPSNKSEWTTYSFYVNRDEGVENKDATLVAHGVLSSGAGPRADIEIFDDCVTEKNAVINPADKPKVISAINGTWLSRLDKGGKVVYIGTPWADGEATDDIQSKASKGDGWCVLRCSVGEDLGGIDIKVAGAPADYEEETGIVDGGRIPLWERFHKAELQKRFRRVGKVYFDLAYRLIRVTKGSTMFPSFGKCWHDFSLTDGVIIQKAWPKIIGVDLSGVGRPGNALFVGAVNPTNQKRYPLEIRIGAWSAPETARQISELNKLYDPTLIVVETNGYQKALVDYSKAFPDMHSFWPKLVPFITTGQKNSLELGLPSLETEFSNDAWEISYSLTEGHEPYCACGACTWKRDMENYIASPKTPDTTMACYFFREGCNKLTAGFGGFRTNI